MDTTLSATLRTDYGKSVARKLRAAGQIPAVVYGAGDAGTQSITVDPKALYDIFRKTLDSNTIVNLDISGKKVPTLVRTVQRHPLSRAILHVDFFRPDPDGNVEAEVPVVATGKAVGLVLGGKITVLRRTVTVTCRYDRIPKVIEVDVTALDVGQFIKASQLKLPENVSVAMTKDFNVVSCWGKKK
jgi:large subunit ribosomal protein L25